ncbi:MAG: carboxymuconolactone decarboxylase family protein [Bdellovibrionales bacterium]
MSIFKLHDVNSAPADSKVLLEGVQKKFGFVPNLMKVFAESPVALQAYGAVSEILEKSSFSPIERQLVLLAVSYANKCEYCVAVHSMISKNTPEVDKQDVEKLRQGEPLTNKKLDILVQFTKQLVSERGFVSEAEQKKFLNAGYTPQNILEILVAIGLKTISNYTNHLAQTPLDEAFQSEKWTAK